MVEKVTPDKAVEAMGKYGGTVIKTSLSKEGRGGASGRPARRRYQLSTSSDQLKLAGPAHRLAAVRRRQLAVDVPEVGLDGVDGDVHLAGDLGGV